mmetsp:Transcript_50831/g.119519  ORF Transcript_50831/g.119519 Transcript_50831/m.119519 type:complete len:133 (-) Transcript_50831:222-620(-)
MLARCTCERMHQDVDLSSNSPTQCLDNIGLQIVSCQRQVLEGSGDAHRHSSASLRCDSQTITSEHLVPLPTALLRSARDCLIRSLASLQLILPLFLAVPFKAAPTPAAATIFRYLFESFFAAYPRVCVSVTW